METLNSDQPDIEHFVKDGDVDGLIAALGRSYDPEIRVQAASALGQIGGKNATNALVGALGADDISVRVAAARALRWIGDKSAVDELIRALDDPAPEVTLAAARALGSSKDPRAVIPLTQKLTMELATGRMAVAEALGELQDSRAIEGLARLLESRTHTMRVTAIASLKRIEPKWVTTESGQVIFARLVAQLGHDDPHLRRDASLTLGEVGEAAAAERLLDVLGDSELMVRLAAGDALIQLGVSETFDPLANTLLEETKYPLEKGAQPVQDSTLDPGHLPWIEKDQLNKVEKATNQLALLVERHSGALSLSILEVLADIEDHAYRYHPDEYDPYEVSTVTLRFDEIRSQASGEIERRETRGGSK